MRVKRAASIPLVLHDPFFSIWSSADHLYDADPVHWCGVRQQMRGYLKVDGKLWCFLGDREHHDVIPQKSIDVTATATEYEFENDEVNLKVRFTSPILPEDMVMVSRPCTYVDFKVEKKSASEVEVIYEVSADLVRQGKDKVVGFANDRALSGLDFAYASMGRAAQQPLAGSGDHVTIDWGYAYLASDEADAEVTFDWKNEKLRARLPIGESGGAGLILAYDDLLSINYFGQWRKAYWTEKYATILDAIGAAFADKKETQKKAAALDQDIEEKALAVGGRDYAFLCSMSFRHAFAAHKLIKDEEGNVIFLSKENDSNGCIGTVDVTYPSVPLFLMYNAEYVKGMLRPVFKMAACDVWEYDFAPHDVGRYPYAWGQVYGLYHATQGGIVFDGKNGSAHPPFYQYPAGADVYDFKDQMPVEECGNMLILMAVVCEQDGDVDFARQNWEVLGRWKDYLLKYGEDPGDQLCTDDFAGRLSHNVNLSVKAIMGVEAYAKLASMLGLSDVAQTYHEKAKEMAASWEKRADVGDHYSLTFDKPDSWSLKYNLVWDKIWGSDLFSDEVYEKEFAYYEKMTREYGTPLDSRCNYTKSDWILWCTAMMKDKEQAAKLIAPVAHYLETTTTRVPFSDWYDAVTGKYYYFIARSVQGGIFMPMYCEKMK